METGDSQLQPLVSVIIPLFNGGKHIAQCLESVLAQTYRHLEIHVIDDRSSDDGYAIASSFANRYPIVFCYKHVDEGNHGIAATRNYGILQARGDWIALIDQDDIWAKDKIEKQMTALLQHPSVQLCYTRTNYIDPNGQLTKLDTFVVGGKGKGYTPTNLFHHLLNENVLPTHTVVVRKKALVEFELFADGPRYQYEDWLLWTKIARKYPFLFIPELLASYRIHSTNYTHVRQQTGLHFEAELHFVIDLYAHLIRTEGLTDEIRNLLMRSCRRVLLRARTWRASREELHRQARVLEETFPFLAGKFNRFITLLSLIPTGSAQYLRRLRRKVVRL